MAKTKIDFDDLPVRIELCFKTEAQKNEFLTGMFETWGDEVIDAAYDKKMASDFLEHDQFAILGVYDDGHNTFDELEEALDEDEDEADDDVQEL